MKTETVKNMLDIEVIENPKSDNESNKYVLVATLQHEERSDQESKSDEVISVKAFRQRREDQKDKEPPWNSSKEASRRAKEELERAKQAQKERPREQTKTMRGSETQVAWEPEEKRPLRNAVEEATSSSPEESSDDREDIDAPEGGKEIQSEPQSRGRTISPERSVRTEGSLRLEPRRREKTMTTEKRIVPIKKDPITKLKRKT